MDEICIVSQCLRKTLTDFEELIKSRQAWCSDCKDYDHESNRCLKYDRMVKKELIEMREKLKEKGAE